jgi:diguanylate cyclase (GGDEF)-like protein
VPPLAVKPLPCQYDAGKHMLDDDDDVAHLVIEHFRNLLTAVKPPEIMPEFADDEDFCKTHEIFIALRELLVDFSRGNVRTPITKRGFVFGTIKALQANLEHMIWQVQQVANDDFSQRMSFMGEFASAFNSMVTNLAAARADLVARQEAFAKLVESLNEEIRLRSSNLLALRESEERFKYLAEHDTLTGSLNRRSFLGRVEIEIQKAVFTGKPCAMAMLDVDYFKHFNDTFGHSAGDAALKHLVSISGKNLRATDFMGRHGGEEFVFFFADANESDAMVAAERIRKAIEGNLLVFEGTPMPMTVSIGVCVLLPFSGAHAKSLIDVILNTADGALYQAKKEGRNRCIIVSMNAENCSAGVDSREDEPEKVSETKKYIELAQVTGSDALQETLQAFDAIKSLSSHGVTFSSAETGSGQPVHPPGKSPEQEEDEFAYFKDYE